MLLRMKPALGMFEYVGRRTLAGFGYLGEVVTMILQFAIQLPKLRGVSATVLWRQVQFIGLEAVPFTALLALLTSLSVVAQIQLVGLGQSQLFGKLLVVVLVRELGPLIVALVVIARSGTAIVTELGNMRVAGEVRALRLAGIDPFGYLVVPRLASVAVAVFCLGQVFIAIALAGGYVLSRLLVEDAPPLGEYIGELTAQLSAADALILAIKTVIPGLLIAAITCREGLTGPPIATEVPRTTTRAVVRAIAAVFAWDALVTATIYKLL